MLNVKAKSFKVAMGLVFVVVFCLYGLSSKQSSPKTINKNIYPQPHWKQITTEPTTKTTTEPTTKTTTEPTTKTTAEPTTTTSDNNNLKLNEIIHTIKTSWKFHNTRVEPILLTWFRQVAAQSYFITDKDDLAFRIKAHPGHLVVSQCQESHNSSDLNCKMNIEFDTAVDVSRGNGATKWWCHWDDDNYVNIRQLVTLLEKYDPREQWYIGRAIQSYPQPYNYRGRSVSAWFATGGCGFCISKPLIDRMIPHTYGRKLMNYFPPELGVTDDCLIGFIVNYILGVNLTQSTLLNSHYHCNELLSFPTDQLKNQISLSYTDRRGEECAPFINESVKSFPVVMDPTRFYSVHCLVNPDVPYCKRIYLFDYLFLVLEELTPASL